MTDYPAPFGREDLPEKTSEGSPWADRSDWDWWAALAEAAHKRKPVPHDHPIRVPGCFRCDLSADESP